MTKLLTLALLGCCGLLLTAADVQAGRRGCCCTTAAPAVAVPAPPVTAAAPQAYRSYSYQPGTTSNYNNYREWGLSGHSYENAANKSRGRVN